MGVSDLREADEPAFSGLAERHRRELPVHCYRMLGACDRWRGALAASPTRTGCSTSCPRAPRPRAVLILRDVPGRPAKDVAELLGDWVNSVNSALQRAGTPAC